MKQKLIKGFTLIELIVVMAIFMVIMVAAMALMQPVSKMMTLSEVRESGSAQVNSISKYLQTQFGSVEYIMTANFIPTDNGEAFVNEFVEKYYEGVLKSGAGTTPTANDYGKGKVHVMTIDNTKGGLISEWVYDVSFHLHDGSGYITGTPTYEEYAVNKAYYDNTTYRIELGLQKGSDATTVTMTDFMNSVNANNTSFSITAFMTRGVTNPQVYSFTTTATTPLVNIFERKKADAGSGGTGCVKGKYYVVDEKMDTTTTPPTYSASIKDICAINLSSKSVDPTLAYSRMTGGLSTVEPVWPRPDNTQPVNGPNSRYTFVYSFGSEMLTS